MKLTKRSLLPTVVSVAFVTVLVAGCGSDKKVGSSSAASSTAAPRVAFASPANGATVKTPVTVNLTASNFTIEPAGDVHTGAGHLHVMIDVGCVAPGTAIPKDDSHVHLGKGQLSTDMTLTPGTHRLCVQAGDGVHTALPLTDEITITVAP